MTSETSVMNAVSWIFAEVRPDLAKIRAPNGSFRCIRSHPTQSPPSSCFPGLLKPPDTSTEHGRHGGEVPNPSPEGIQGGLGRSQARGRSDTPSRAAAAA